MRRIGRALLVAAFLCGAVMLMSTTFRWRTQWLSPAPGPSGEEGWWFRSCAVDAGQFRYTSYSFLGMRGAAPGQPPYRGLEDKTEVVRRNRLGLSWSFTFPSPGGRFDLFLPIWPLTAALAAGGLMLVRRAGRLRRAREQHLCLGCGYDLRASPDRCPECGRPAPPLSHSSPLAPQKP